MNSVWEDDSRLRATFGGNQKEKLEERCRQLLEESYRLSHSDRAKSDQKAKEADAIRAQLDALDSEGR